MVGDEVVVEGSGIDESCVAAAIRRPPGLPQPETAKKSPFERLFRT
jgi:hypothetical protein